MTRVSAAMACLLLASGAAAQEAPAVYQQESKPLVRLLGDALLRQEWNDRFALVLPSRQMGRARPRLEAGNGMLTVGVGGDFVYSSDENTVPPANVRALPLIRDNYRSRDARLDLAFARLQPASWLKLEAGRFVMPVALTEQVWDRDLRPQGAALTLEKRGAGPFSRLSLTGLVTRGGHVFDDGRTEMALVSGRAAVGGAGAATSGEILASFVTWSHLDLEPILLRQNTRTASFRLVHGYQVADLVGRLRHRGAVDAQLVAEGTLNLATSSENHAWWFAGVLGRSVARAEYTYAYVEQDATLAAYAGDDFFWQTGWEGHRVDLGVSMGAHASLHAVGFRSRFAAAPSPADREIWRRRLRLELRLSR